MSLEQVGSLIENCNKQTHKLHNKALIHRWASNLGNLLVIIGSATSGAISAYKGEELIPIIISFTVATIKTLMVFYTPETKALVLERISIEISRLARKLRRLDIATPDSEQVKKTVDRAFDRLDELKFRQFGGDPSKIIEDDLLQSKTSTLDVLSE